MARAITLRPEGVSVSEVVLGGKIMILGSDRVAYVGLLGAPGVREFGCLTVYSSLGRPISICAADSAWAPAELAVVPPYTPHRVATPERMIGVLMIEPESVDLAGLPGLLGVRTAAAVDAREGAAVREAFLALSRGEAPGDLGSAELDRLFFGRALEGRRLDSRIAAIVDRVNRQPHAALPAEEAARLAGLSFSRFLHLFRAEVGATYRGFRAWKRARSFLRYANGAPSLTDVALEMGYPDSTHFSHSIRQVYGLRPKDIFAGSRDLAIVQQAGARAPAHAA